MPRHRRSGEPDVTAGLVRALLASQHPDLAALPIGGDVDPAPGGGVVRGWDNTMVRLGEDLAVRLPRHDAGQALLDREAAWLPRVAAQTGLRLPRPERTGAPGAGYPYRWAVVPWVAGTPAARRPAGTRDVYAAALAGWLRRLHVPAPPDAPANPFRGVPLAATADRFEARWRALRPRCPAALVRAVDTAWRQALAAGDHTGPPVWLHGDPHPDNTVLAEAAAGALPGPPEPVLVDFGDLCAGDPASDLGIALTHFTPAGAAAFQARYEAGRVPDDDLWRRAAGWSLALATLFATQPPEDVLHAIGWGYLRQSGPRTGLSPAAGSAG
ncbi:MULTISPECIES: phosphotransferase [Micrococcaceae]|uniref:phosphotransferase n=1 Tax=Micrococcaceae TaxID=1268 RepID=UPI00161BF29B|nr:MULTISPECIES: phosphotransferase [Micrococcaceae]MBB5748156.1 aminoglycoside phosphotransferase (APT) family kinase protein [Micrococcus sp. TA1]HRO30987.1 phosphotransferase [Citricoccus sp.]HRO92512.1 phosphotransferase [Citricoccus sp.]